MIQRGELPLLKSSGQVSTAIAATAGNTPSSSNSDVATSLSLKRWVVVALRQLYSLARI